MGRHHSRVGGDRDKAMQALLGNHAYLITRTYTLLPQQQLLLSGQILVNSVNLQNKQPPIMVNIARSAHCYSASRGLHADNLRADGVLPPVKHACQDGDDCIVSTSTRAEVQAVLCSAAILD